MTRNVSHSARALWQMLAKCHAVLVCAKYYYYSPHVHGQRSAGVAQVLALEQQLQRQQPLGLARRRRHWAVAGLRGWRAARLSRAAG